MAAAIDNTGMIWVWGDNKKGELGVGDYSTRSNPYPIANLKGKFVESLAIGNNFTIALGKTQKSESNLKVAQNPLL